MEIDEVKKEQAITKEHAPFYSSWKSVLFTTHPEWDPVRPCRANYWQRRRR